MIEILILLPALIIGYLMLSFNKFFAKKIASLIRLMYIIMLAFVTAIFAANKISLEYILISFACFLGILGTVISFIEEDNTNTGELFILISMLVNILLFFVW